MQQTNQSTTPETKNRAFWVATTLAYVIMGTFGVITLLCRAHADDYNKAQPRTTTRSATKHPGHDTAFTLKPIQYQPKQNHR